MNIAIIPARAGSKRIPNKNIRLFADKPIIGYSIEVAIASNLFDRVIVTTDDKEIADISRGFGAEVPFERPPELADDFVGTGPIVKHAVDWLVLNGVTPDFVCCIYATAPFITVENLRNGWDILRKSDKDFAFSVTTFPHPVQRSLRVRETGELEIVNKDDYAKRSQDLEERYHDAAQFYWSKGVSFGRKPIHGNTLPVILPRWLVQDIDVEEDWKMAELMYSALHLGES